MSEPLYDFNSTFFLSLATMTFGFFAGAIGIAYRSKCTSVKICGCLEIIRDVAIEAEIEENTSPPNEGFGEIPRSNSREIPRSNSHEILRTHSYVRTVPPTPTNSFVAHRKSSKINDPQHVDFATSMNATV